MGNKNKVTRILFTPSSIGCLIGVILILISIIVGTEKVIAVIMLSIGTSILASCVFSLINSFYEAKEDEIKKLYKKWGLVGIYKTRAEMNSYSNKQLENANYLEICAMGLKSFRDAQSETIKNRVKEGMRIKILTINPESNYTFAVDKTEEVNTGSTKESINSLIKWVEELKIIQKYDRQIEIQFYDHYPYDFYFCIDNNIYIGPYQNKLSQQTITYRFMSDSEGYSYYKNYFNNLWETYEQNQG